MKRSLLLIACAAFAGCTITNQPPSVEIYSQDDSEVFMNGDNVGSYYFPGGGRMQPMHLEIYKEGHKTAHRVMDKDRLNPRTFLSLFFVFPYPLAALEIVSPRNFTFPKYMDAEPGPELAEIDTDAHGFWFSNFAMADTLEIDEATWYLNAKKYRSGMAKGVAEAPENLYSSFYVGRYDGISRLNAFIENAGYVDTERTFWNQRSNYTIDVELLDVNVHAVNSRESKVEWYVTKCRAAYKVYSPGNELVYDDILEVTSGEFTTHIPYYYSIFDALDNASVDVVDAVSSSGHMIMGNDYQAQIKESTGDYFSNAKSVSITDLPTEHMHLLSEDDEAGIVLPIGEGGQVVMSYLTYMNRKSDTLYFGEEGTYVLGEIMKAPAAGLVLAQTNGTFDKHYGFGHTGDLQPEHDYYVVGQLWDSQETFIEKVDVSAVRDWDNWDILQLDGSYDILRHPLVMDKDGNVIGSVTRNLQRRDISGISFVSTIGKP